MRGSWDSFESYDLDNKWKKKFEFSAFNPPPHNIDCIIKKSIFKHKTKNLPQFIKVTTTITH